MSLGSDRKRDAERLARERQRLLEALEEGPASGPALFRRFHGVSTATTSRAGQAAPAGPGTDGQSRDRAGRRPEPGDQALLYPALHSLESSWTVEASWFRGDDGLPHRTYRRRRILPRPASSAAPKVSPVRRDRI